MFYADTLGLGAVLDGVHRFAESLGATYWTPAPLLEELGRNGGTFQAWGAGARREESGS
jgi:3-hydroxyacyl-CoA dehydrogenase